jgi:hypothetical protein
MIECTHLGIKQDSVGVEQMLGGGRLGQMPRRTTALKGRVGSLA